MGSNAELLRIQEWVSRWYGRPVKHSPFSVEDIRNISRGPMREVLVDFLITRFRTDDQIKVIRSNSFLSDMINSRSLDDVNVSGDTVENQDDEKIKELKQKLADIPEQKNIIVNQVVKALGMINESKVQVQKDLTQNLVEFGKLDSRMQLIGHRVLSTSTLLEDVCNIMPTCSNTSVSTSSSSGNDPTIVESTPPQISQLKTLYQNTTDLFDLYFLQNPPLRFNGSESGSSAEIQTLTSAISSQTVELPQSGLKPKMIEKWARKEQEISIQQIQNVKSKFSNVMSPLEELTKEAETLHFKLMRVHVNLHFKNRELKRFLNELKAQNRLKIQDMVLSNANFVPADFMSFIRKTELQKKLLKCREIAKDIKHIDNAYCNGDDIDMLNMMCVENCNSNSTNKDDKTGSNFRNQFRGSLSGSSDRNSFYMIRQETMEDLTCTLLKSFPEGRSKLETTVSVCKNLIMDKFANLFKGEGSLHNNSNIGIGRIHRATSDDVFELPDLHLKISQKVFSCNPLISSMEQGQNDLLNEVLTMQTAFKQIRVQSEALFNQGSI